jgi:hypothetical protein
MYNIAIYILKAWYFCNVTVINGAVIWRKTRSERPSAHMQADWHGRAQKFVIPPIGQQLNR